MTQYDTIIAFNSATSFTAFPVTNATANVAFDDALTSLPSTGGKLVVFPHNPAVGHYLFAAPVTVSKSNVSIELVGQTIIRTAVTTLGSLFTVTGNRFRFLGGNLAESVVPTVNRNLIQLQADDAVIDGTRFSFAQAPAGLLLNGVSILGAVTPTFRRGNSVRNCLFEWSHAQPTNMGSRASPNAYVAVRGFYAPLTSIRDNRFSHPSIGSTAYPGGLVHLGNSPHSVVSGNRARFCNSYGSSTGASSLFYSYNTSNEDGHIIWSNNAVHDCGGYSIINEQAANFSLIQNNTLGRCDCVAGAITLENAAKCSVMNNDLHNIAAELVPGAPSTGYCINVLNSSRQVLIHGNLMSEQNASTGGIYIDSTCTNIRCNPQNQVFWLQDGISARVSGKNFIVWQDSFGSEDDPPLYPKTKRNIG